MLYVLPLNLTVWFQVMLIAVNWGWVFSDAGTDSFSLSHGTAGEDAWVGDNDRELYFLD